MIRAWGAGWALLNGVCHNAQIEWRPRLVAGYSASGGGYDAELLLGLGEVTPGLRSA